MSANKEPVEGVPAGMDPVYYAQYLLKRKRFDGCIAICTEMLSRNPYDQAVWYLKTRALTQKTYIDDIDMEEEGIADILLDENEVSKVPRPGTSLRTPLKSRGGDGSMNPGVRPMSGAGRPTSGFVRPGTSSRPQTNSLEGALAGSRPGTSRPVTSSGRFVRLGTASMLSEPGGPFINVEKLDLRKYAARTPLAKVLCDYIIYHEHNPKKALELCAHATTSSNYQDWWWKARLGKCYYQLGLYREAEKQFLSALKTADMVITTLELCKVYIKLDQPNTALDNYTRAAERHPGDTQLLLGISRIYDQLNDVTRSIQFYKRVLYFDASSIEAVACLAAHHFYSDQPEIALRFYRRLLLMGVNTAEIWTNLGLCCFYASQYDMTLTCFERALNLADDTNMADVWFNIGQVAIGIGDLGLGYQSFKIALSIDGKHAESFNNLGVLELKKGNVDQSRNNFQTSYKLAEHMYEPAFNGGLLAFKLGDFQESFDLAKKSLQCYPDHADSHELMKQLKQHFSML
uniref:Tetratricopeptide repeat protein 8 n=1 Tax=Palpitomonas bilix TaxID=652834 RepID=A0A7S3G6M4_9EUKA|mmetsp:Transcript_31021/g.81450  ORF Transcript_31021/g.81450 Transcript_31021/m.81450 type:complete len:516 (+) Transcript_31021:63-1610(+)